MLKIVATTTKSSNQVTISFSVCTHQVMYHAGRQPQGSRMTCITHLSWGGGPLHLGVGVTKENTAVKYWMEQHYLHKGETGRSASVVNFGPQWPAVSPDGQLRVIGLCSQLSHYGERNLDPSCGVWNTESWQYAWGPLTYRLKQNQGVLTVPETGKDIPIQSDKPSIGCVDSLSLHKEEF